MSKDKVSKKDKRKIKEIKPKKKTAQQSHPLRIIKNLKKDIQETEEILEETEFREFLNPQTISAPSLQKILIPEPLKINTTSSPILDTSEAKENEPQRGIYTSSGESQKYSQRVVDKKEENKYNKTPGSDFFNPTRFEDKRATGLAQEISPLDINPHQAINPKIGTINPFGEVEKKYKEGEF